MTIDKTIAAMLMIPVIGLAIPSVVFFRKLPDTGLTPSERELISFSSQPVSVSQPGRPAVFSGLECPVRPPAVKEGAAKASTKSFPPGPIPTLARERSRVIATQALPSVTMIYSDGQSRMAIINGHVLREGATIAGSKVIKIEKTRVLIRTAGKDIWLHID
ncbi:MAG TPA: general secretion pathway protein GspB [Geobacteraceae bacterium]